MLKIHKNDETRSPDDGPESSEMLQRLGHHRCGGSRYKGVVPQPNGRWGAQIYVNGQRFWLGTYRDQDEAAKAYDIAALCFRGRGFVALNFQRNGAGTFGGSGDTDADIEAEFLQSHPKEGIVDMLRAQTYHEELQQMMKQKFDRLEEASCLLQPSSGQAARKILFQKMLTPSDVGKQNRLVIPKRHAEKYFPLKLITNKSEEFVGGHNSKTIKSVDNNSSGRAKVRPEKALIFQEVDGGGRLWRFRLAYWNRSRSYAITRGWSRFLKEKNLKAGDKVSFEQSTGRDERLYIHYYKPAVRVFQERQAAPPIMRLFGKDIALGGGGLGGGVGAPWL
ncbi:hypothetical protein SAY86_011582 [Trapa natans]|uniref:Uncharacterized protein n=1 Tax=Trapa natans TaxID=22666 RepID=A0AAN7LMG5_TRANT|nr:hypothetical protein SAY86_011582 [Trapa natans]